MLHDLDNSDEEPDFTCVDLPKRYNTEIEEPAKSDRLPRKYAPEDLLSVETDPSCKPNWFLAAYWPVYVGNFKVEQWEESTWYEQVSNYFAYNGLLTRMIYIHHRQQNDKEYSTYQRLCMLIDMLVYFTSKADAERAIATCHRDSYYGYKLNVLPGRKPMFFDNERSVRFSALGMSSKFTPVETVMENALSNYGPVKFAGRYPNETVVLEFVSTQAMVAGVASQFRWKPAPQKREFMKQRFLEEDVKMDLEWAKESNPTFMDMQPKASVLVQLFEGVRPNVSTSWKGHEIYVKAAALAKRRKETKQRMRMLHYNKKYKIEKPKKVETETVTPDPAALPPAKTKRQTEQDNMKSINWFLRQYGAAPISRATVREVQTKVQKQMQEKVRAEKLLQEKIKLQKLMQGK